jgi:hypothetical protein
VESKVSGDWNKGIPLSAEHRVKISAALMGHRTWNKGIPMLVEIRAKESLSHKGQVPWNKGLPLSDEHKAKLSAVHKGKPGRPQSLESRAKDSVAHMGYVPTPEARARNAAAQWKGGPAVWMPKQNAKRRAMGYVPLNPVFPGCEGHHVDNEQVINMPKPLHRSVYHNQTTGQGMAAINAIAYDFLFDQELEST